MTRCNRVRSTVRRCPCVCVFQAAQPQVGDTVQTTQSQPDIRDMVLPVSSKSSPSHRRRCCWQTRSWSAKKACLPVVSLHHTTTAPPPITQQLYPTGRSGLVGWLAAQRDSTHFSSFPFVCVAVACGVNSRNVQWSLQISESTMNLKFISNDNHFGDVSLPFLLLVRFRPWSASPIPTFLVVLASACPPFLSPTSLPPTAEPSKGRLLFLHRRE